MHPLFRLLFLSLVLSIIPNSLWASDSSPEVAELKQQVASLSDLVRKLSARVEELETAKSFEKELGSIPVTTRSVSQSPTPTGGSVQNSNPDISVVGVAIGKFTNDHTDTARNALLLDESEVVFTKNVSPYTRANLTVGLKDGETEVEEGYADVSHVLPGRWQARIGKFLTPLGYLNTVHSHDWPMVAKPLPMLQFMGEEGLKDQGVGLSTLIDTRSKTFVRLELDALHGDNELLYNAGKTRTYGGRLFANTPLNDRDDLNYGLNAFQGAWDPTGDLSSKVYGVDMMWRRRFNQFDRLALWGEWLWNKREQAVGSAVSANGYYMTALYKFKKDHDWHVGLEYDCTQRPGDTSGWMIGKSAFIGYWLTENDRLQFQLRTVRDPWNDRTNNEALVEFIWGMGPHKAHLANF